MAHFMDLYADRVIELMHEYLGTLFFEQKIVEVPGVLAGLVITYEGVKDDTREAHDRMSREAFLNCMSLTKPDVVEFDRKMEELGKSTKVFLGWRNRTIFFIRPEGHPEEWTSTNAQQDAIVLLKGSALSWGPGIQSEAEHLKENVPVGREHFGEYEQKVRVISLSG
jgi:hypothetical protein